MILSSRLRSAGRVARTLHQVLVAVVLTLPVIVAHFNLPAEKVGQAGVVVAAGATFVAKVYNVLFPAEPPLDEV